jgi:hypothetical protein
LDDPSSVRTRSARTWTGTSATAGLGAGAPRSAISAMKASTTAGSNWLPAMSRSSWQAASWPMAGL